MVKMKKRLNNRQLIIISTLVGVIIFTLETVIDLLVGGTLTVCIILGNILWGVILGYLMFKLVKLRQMRKENIHDIE
jgi:hypothetical protein